MGWRVLSYYTVLLVLKSGQLVANQIWEFFVVMISRKICPFVAKLIFSRNQAKEDEFLKNAFVCYSPAVTKGLMWLYAKIAYNHMYHVIRCTFQVAFNCFVALLRDVRNFSADKNVLVRIMKGKTSCDFVRISLLDKHYSPPRHIRGIYVLCILVFFSTRLQFWEFIYLKLHKFSVSNLGLGWWWN